ncbi:MAG: ABC transporter ATP-binding protein [Verrucomicrobiales bacterium]|nr:ABC transporter ATP-binding protein [Verrucomicrobiales bacterium]MCP5528429.1 ABC transporter ATP-binding protein [Verrucomicrobiales bacterium]
MLQLNDLAKNFGGLRAVDGVSLKVSAGETYGLLGPNGAGKTTTISMISGLLRPDQGSVVVDGQDFWGNPARSQRLMGVVPQEVALYDELSGLDNLCFWGRLAGLARTEVKPRAAEVLEALSLADRSREPVRNYSGGMKRRINIGCALMHRPKLLLLDEPTVGIDPQARQNILDFIRRLARDGTAILYTTHYLEEAETLCDRVGIIDNGRLLAEGTLAELQARVSRTALFLIEGRFADARPEEWPAFSERFTLIQHTPRQWLVAAREDRDPADCLRDLLELPVRPDNVTLKRPSLNDVFLQLTGRELRE